MFTTRYAILSMLSGSVWAGIAYLLGHRWMMPFLWGGIVASPFIGLLIGEVSRPIYRQSRVPLVLWSLLTLYLAAAIFELAAGITDALLLPLNRINSEVIEQSVIGTVIGTSVYMAFLWPLSIMNHLILRRFDDSA